MNLKHRGQKKHRYLDYLCRKYNISYEELLVSHSALLSKKLDVGTPITSWRRTSKTAGISFNEESTTCGNHPS